MNKKMLITAIALMLLTIGLSGCNEINGNTDTTIGNNVVQIINWYNGTYKAVNNLYANGFVYREDMDLLYIVNGTAKNNASQEIRVVTIHIKYYDINNTLLLDDGILENGIKPGQTWDFWSFFTNDLEHFKDVHHVEFDISGEFEE